MSGRICDSECPRYAFGFLRIGRQGARLMLKDQRAASRLNQGSAPPLHGMTRFRDLFTPRQLATLCAFGHGARRTTSRPRVAPPAG
jgi:hypothetical protein